MGRMFCFHEDGLEGFQADDPSPVLTLTYSLGSIQGPSNMLDLS